MNIRKYAWILIAPAAGAWLAACDRGGQGPLAPRELAVSGAPPVVEIPIGPRPGPAQALVLPENPYANDDVALATGRELFVRFNCAGCHGGHGGGGMGPSLRDPVWMYGSSDASIFDSVSEGRAHGMPAWGLMLPREEIWKITAYVKALGQPHEPEAPMPRSLPPAGPDVTILAAPAGFNASPGGQP